MICLEVVAGVVHVVNPQPSDLSACSLVAGSYSETVSELMQISPEQGASISAAIMLVWAVAWVFRQIIRTLNVGKNEGNQNE